MSETRILPPSKPRSTGIDRTTQITSKPVHGAGSHISASPSAGPQAQRAVVAARQPGPPVAGRAAPGTTLIDKIQPGARAPTTQIVSLEAQRKIEDLEAQLARVTSPFSNDEGLLINYLLEGFSKSMGSDGRPRSAIDQQTAASARDRVCVMLGLKPAASAASVEVEKIATSVETKKVDPSSAATPAGGTPIVKPTQG